MLNVKLFESVVEQSLVIFDCPGAIIFENSRLLSLVKQRNVHIVVVSKSFVFSDALRKSINDRLLRGTVIYDIQPLSTIHTTQRVVYSILKHNHLAPSNAEQDTFEKLAQFTNGSPEIVDVVSSLLHMHFDNDNSILSFADRVQLDELGPSTKPPSVPWSPHSLPTPTRYVVRHIDKCVYDTIPTVHETENPWVTSSYYDSWQAVTVLIDQCNLIPEERILLNCLAVLNCTPIPASLISEMAAMICKASHMPFLAPSLHTKLTNVNLLKTYPKPLVYFPKGACTQGKSDVTFCYVPQFVSEALWKDMMTDSDRAMALAIPYKALKLYFEQYPSDIEKPFLIGMCSVLVEQFEQNFALVGKECYQELYRFFLGMKLPI